MKMKRILCLLCVAVMLLPGIAMGAAKDFVLWLSPDGERNIRAIDWYKERNVYYLFLPGNIQPEQMKIGFTEADSITIDKKKVNNGDSADFLKVGKSYTVGVGKKSYELKILQGNADLPSLFITTDSGKLDYIQKKKENKEPGKLVFISPTGEIEYDDLLTHIKIRGNSSVTFPKKNYQIKLQNGTNLCGMGKSKTWILSANYRDKSLLRNQITMDLAMYAGLAYTPEHIAAEVYINHQYEGLYLFSEKVAIDDDRVDIFDLESATEELNDGDVSGFAMKGAKSTKKTQYKYYEIPQEPEDCTGGYLFEYEAYHSRYAQEASAYYTKHANTVVIKSPEYCTQNQMVYITSLIQSFENAIFAKDGIDPGTGKHYSELFDMDSLVKKYMLEEISKNYDGNNSSQYFYKPADSQSTLAYAGPAWDYDSAYGSYAQKRTLKKLENGKGLWIGNATAEDYWWPALYKQADFHERVLQTYDEVYRHGLQILLGKESGEGTPLRSLEEYASAIEASAEMNVLRWPRQKKNSIVAQTGYSFRDNIKYLTQYLTERVEFLDKEWSLTGK